MTINTPEFTKADMARIFPALKPEDRQEQPVTSLNTFRVVARIYERAERGGKIPKRIERAADKRFKQMMRRNKGI